MIKLIQGDCLEVMATLEENSIDLVIADPPYFKVKTEWWDRQWETPEGFIAWIDCILEQLHRVLKPNGSLYLFASPKMSARIELAIGQRFNVLNNITWTKPNEPGYEGWHKKCSKESLRQWYPLSERIIFAEHYGVDNIAKGEAGYGAKCDELRGFLFEPLRAYLDGERERAGVTPEQCNLLCGHREQGGMAGRHYFSVSQWCLPTAENYAKLRQGFHDMSHGSEYLRRDYEYLRREYEDLRRPFSVTADVPYTDVWDFPTVQTYPGKHPCEKPQEMLEHMIIASSRPSATVLDFCMGSGNTGRACVQTGRDFIGIDIMASWCNVATNRIQSAIDAQSLPHQIEMILS